MHWQGQYYYNIFSIKILEICYFICRGYAFVGPGFDPLTTLTGKLQPTVNKTK